MNIKEMATANAESAFDCANEYPSIWVSIGAYNENALDTLGDYGIDTLENQLLVNKEFMNRVAELLEEKTIAIRLRAFTK